MGAKSPEGHQQAPNGGDANSLKPTQPENAGRNSGSQSADLDRGIVGEDGGDDDDDEASAVGPGSGLIGTRTDGQKKKKRKKRSKAKKPSSLQQTTPPTVLVSDLFPSGVYPKGELIAYDNLERITEEERRYNSRKWDGDFLLDYRHAAEIHRQVRQHVQQNVIKPGVRMSAIAEEIDAGVRALCGHQGLEPGDPLIAGLAFPTGLSLNNVAAHWTPNPGGPDPVLDAKDVLSVDFGVHVNGRIVDSAFTVSHDPTYDNLLAAVKAATNTGLAHAGVDVPIADISTAIQEVMESYEVEVNGKAKPVKAVRSLCGHDILRHQIHGNKQIPFVRNSSRQRMEEGEVFAIETFGSTGKGHLRDDVGVYGYGRQKDVSSAHVQMASAKALLKTIDASFGTIVFCRRYLERLGVKSYHLGMKHLIETGIVDVYPPLVEAKDACVAQFEHTVLIGESGKEIISRGEDY